jgi:hypothetical protein
MSIRSLLTLAPGVAAAAVAGPALAGLTTPFAVGSYLGAAAPESTADYDVQWFETADYVSLTESDGAGSTVNVAALFSATGFSHLSNFNLADGMHGSTFVSARLAAQSGGSFNMSWSWSGLVGKDASWLVLDAATGDIVLGLEVSGGTFTTWGLKGGDYFGSTYATLVEGEYIVLSTMSDAGPVTGSSGFASVVWEFTPIPAPGALALAGLAGVAGLAGRRRR